MVIHYLLHYSKYKYAWNEASSFIICDLFDLVGPPLPASYRITRNFCGHKILRMNTEILSANTY